MMMIVAVICHPIEHSRGDFPPHRLSENETTTDADGHRYVTKLPSRNTRDQFKSQEVEALVLNRTLLDIAVADSAG